MTTELGPVAASVAAFTAGVGDLSGRRGVAAAQAMRLARLLDDEEAGSAASSLARELRQVIASLDSAVTLPSQAPNGEVTHEDPVARVQDQVAKKRRERAGQA